MFKKDDDQVYLRAKESKSSTKSPHVKRKYVIYLILFCNNANCICDRYFQFYN